LLFVSDTIIIVSLATLGGERKMCRQMRTKWNMSYVRIFHSDTKYKQLSLLVNDTIIHDNFLLSYYDFPS